MCMFLVELVACLLVFCMVVVSFSKYRIFTGMPCFAWLHVFVFLVGRSFQWRFFFFCCCSCIWSSGSLFVVVLFWDVCIFFLLFMNDIVSHEKVMICLSALVFQAFQMALRHLAVWLSLLHQTFNIARYLKSTKFLWGIYEFPFILLSSFSDLDLGSWSGYLQRVKSALSCLTILISDCSFCLVGEAAVSVCCHRDWIVWL